MLLFDVNVLIYSANDLLPDHPRYRAWLRDLLDGPQAFGVSDLVLSSFLRLATNRSVLKAPMELGSAIEFVRGIKTRSTCVTINPGARHWNIFIDLCERVGARGNLVPDAYLAALAIESGCEWITTDRDYARFPGLRWRHPLDG
jgi:toxin-antitoxin system PIN domain toxin